MATEKLLRVSKFQTTHPTRNSLFRKLFLFVCSLLFQHIDNAENEVFLSPHLPARLIERVTSNPSAHEKCHIFLENGGRRGERKRWRERRKEWLFPSVVPLIHGCPCVCDEGRQVIIARSRLLLLSASDRNRAVVLLKLARRGSNALLPSSRPPHFQSQRQFGETLLVTFDVLFQ